MTSSFRRLASGWLMLAAAPGCVSAAVISLGAPAGATAAAGAALTALILVAGWRRLVGPLLDGMDSLTASARRLEGDEIDLESAAPPPAPANPAAEALAPLERQVDRLALRACTDAARLRRLERQLGRCVDQDALTGLASRQGALGRLNEVLAGDHPVAVVLADIDRFRLVNDTFGQRAADEVLRSAAGRIRGAVERGPAGERATVARWGADQFLVVLPDADRRLAEMVAANVAEALTEPIAVGDHHVTISADTATAEALPSSGPAARRPADRLLKQADHRLTVQRNRPDRPSERVAMVDTAPIVLSTGRSDPDRSRHELVRDAITENRLEVWFQPIFSVTSDEHVVPTGAEALVRLRSRQDEVLAPADFLPGVDRSDLGRKLDERVAAMALDHLHQWQQAGLIEPGFRLALNLCGVSASDVNFTTFLADQMRRFRIDPERVIVELPESAAQIDPSVVERMRQLGVTVAIDDFGLSSSNLDRAEDFGAEIVKLDRRWMGPPDRPIDDRELQILRALVQLCASLDVHVVAEGIETIDQLLLLLDLGVSDIQGYFLSKPLAADDFAALVSRYRSRALVVD